MLLSADRVCTGVLLKYKNANEHGQTDRARFVIFKTKVLEKSRTFCGGGCEIRTHVCVSPNGFQDFLTNPTLPQNKRKYQTIENAENPDVARAFGVLSFLKSKTPSGARISVSKTISKDFLEKVLDKSSHISPVASHIIYQIIR